MNDASESLVIFGVSNMLGDIFDCAIALDIRIGAVVMNQPEVKRERTKTVSERLEALKRPVQLLELEHFRRSERECFCIGTTAPERTELVDLLRSRFSLTFVSLIHPTAYVSPLASVGEGVFVGAKSVIGPGAHLGDFSFVNRGVTVGHDTRIGPFARLQPGCNIGGHVVIGKGATIGIGASVIQELRVGARAMVAAGAVVLRDVEEATLVAGVPAEFKKSV